MTQDEINQKVKDDIKAIQQCQMEILESLKPITEVFITIRKGGKWTAATIIFIGSVVTLLVGAESLFGSIIHKIMEK